MSILELVQTLDTKSLTLLTAGICVIGACHFSTLTVNRHLQLWTKPREQMAIFYIVLMVPLFALDSYIGLVEMPEWEVWVTVLDAVKECYEAFVIGNFLKLMYCYMGVSPDPKAPLPDAIKGRVLHHSFPVTLFQPHEVIVDKQTLRTLRWFTRQFVIVRPVFSILLCVLEILDLYKPPITYVFMAVFNVSVYLAIYALLLFYHAFAEELAPHNPLAKFLCIKGVVFFAFWQGLLIKLMAAFGVIHSGHFPYSVEQIEEAMQNFIVCVEMLVFAVAFMYAFSADEYNPSYKPPPPKKAIGSEAKAAAAKQKKESAISKAEREMEELREAAKVQLEEKAKEEKKKDL